MGRDDSRLGRPTRGPNCRAGGGRRRPVLPACYRTSGRMAAWPPPAPSGSERSCAAPLMRRQLFAARVTTLLPMAAVYRDRLFQAMLDAACDRYAVQRRAYIHPVPVSIHMERGRVRKRTTDYVGFLPTCSGRVVARVVRAERATSSSRRSVSRSTPRARSGMSGAQVSGWRRGARRAGQRSPRGSRRGGRARASVRAPPTGDQGSRGRPPSSSRMARGAGRSSSGFAGDADRDLDGIP